MILVRSKVIIVTGSCPGPLLRCLAGGSWVLCQKENKLNEEHIKDRGRGTATELEEERQEEE